MAVSKQLRRRITAAGNISKITKAMETVAASKMRKAQNIAISGEPYQQALDQVIKNLTRQLNPALHPLLRLTNDQKNLSGLSIIISSDRGLCGGFNTNLFRLVEQNLNDESKVIVLGKKAHIYAQKTSWEIMGSIAPLSDTPDYNLVKPAGTIAQEEFLSRRISRVSIVYQKFINTLICQPTVVQLLPVVTATEKSPLELPKSDYIFEPNRASLLDEVLPYYLFLSIYQAVLSSKAAEQSARMVAMKNASENADQVKKELNLVYNRERQRAITAEIADVVTAILALE